MNSFFLGICTFLLALRGVFGYHDKALEWVDCIFLLAFDFIN